MEVQMSQAEGNLPEQGNHSAATVINMTREGIICPGWMKRLNWGCVWQMPEHGEVRQARPNSTTAGVAGWENRCSVCEKVMSLRHVEGWGLNAQGQEDWGSQGIIYVCQGNTDKISL